MTSSHSSPPKELSEPLEVDTSNWNSRDLYFLTTGLVIPRPIGWISTVSADGIDNLAPYSYFNAVAPDHVIFSSSGNEKDSIANVRASREFVANIVTMDVLEQMNFTATDFPSQVDEFGWANLTKFPSRKVSACRVGEAKAHFECECVDIVKAGESYIVIGHILQIHITPEIWRDGRVDPERLNPVCRLSGNYYASLGDIYRLERPTWNNINKSTTTNPIPKLSKGD